ncbi:hypothetical protein F2981_15625 [Sinorhizobium meliloti]|nr:hypothetical protein [Sinorhizobium meliloti]
MAEAHDVPAKKGPVDAGRTPAALFRLHCQGVLKLRLTGGEPLVAQEHHVLIPELGKEIEAGRLDELTLTHQRLSAFEIRRRTRRLRLAEDQCLARHARSEQFRQITRWGEWARVHEGIDAALAAGLKVKINAVALKDFNDGRDTGP